MLSAKAIKNLPFESNRLKVTKLIRVLLVIKKMYIQLANLNLLTCYKNLENSCYEPHWHFMMEKSTISWKANSGSRAFE